MTEKLKVEDRVRIGSSHKIWRVQEVDPPGVSPSPPSTYVVTVVADDGTGPSLLYGNHVLTRLP